MLKKVCFIVGVLGIAFLLILLLIPARSVVSLENQAINSKVFIEGKILSERDMGDFWILELTAVSGSSAEIIDVVCDCDESYIGKVVVIEGIVEEYKGEKQVRVLKIYEN